MRFSEIVLCHRRQYCNSIPCSQEFQQTSSGTSAELIIANKRSEHLGQTTNGKLAALENAIMSIWPRLRKRHRGLKSNSKPNPYASRGLDKFASVSAELAAKRESLAAQTGAPLSIVRFTTGSHSKWIPVFVSDHSSITSDRRPVTSSTSNTFLPTEATGDNISIRSTRVPVPVSDISISLRSISFKAALTDHGGVANPGGLEMVSEGKFNNRLFLGIPEQWSKFAKQASFVAMILGALWIGKVPAVGAALAFGLLQHDWNLQRNESDPGTLDGTPSNETDLTRTGKNHIEYHRESKAFITLGDLSELESRPKISHDVPSTEIVGSVAVQGKDHSTQKGRENGDGKRHSRFKSKFLRRHARKEEPISAPSSPTGENGDNLFSSSTPSSPAAGRSSFSLQTKSVSVPPSHWTGKKSLKRRASHETLQRKTLLHHSSLSWTKRPAGVEATLTTVGLCLILLGLLAGRCFAVFILVCWWYIVPLIRQYDGDQGPSIRGRSNPEKLAQKSSKNLVTLGIGKLDLHSNEYKKKIIMEGLLDRNRKSTS